MEWFATLHLIRNLPWTLVCRWLVLGWVAGGLGGWSSVSAQEIALPEHPDNIWSACQLCHGTKEIQRGPILDGLPAWYVLHQLGKFSQNIRGSCEENRSERLMAPVVQQYANPDLWSEAAAIIASLPPPEHLHVIRGNPDRGKLLFAVCSSCHGPMADGNPELKAPPLNIQEDWYLMEQLRKFQTKQRGYDERDTEGRLMQNIASMFTVNDLKDIVAYISRIGPKARRPFEETP